MTASALTPGLMLVHGNRPEDLRDLLVEWMARYPLAPLENEIILVQSNGIAQWLKLALAADADPGSGKLAAGERGVGIAAALEISLPARFLWRVYRAVLGNDAVPEVSPFDKSRLVWRLMRLLPELLARPEYMPLRRFLQTDADLRKRFQLAERLADLYDQYQVYRADWLAAWGSGEDVLIQARGGRIPLPDEQRWQSGLWRALLADVDKGGEGREQDAAIGRAGVHEAFLRRVSDWPEDTHPRGLPRRVMVFGISSLPRQSLEVLAGMARWSQVLMCVHNPCEHYWADIVADKDLLRAERTRQRRRHGMPTDLSEERMHLHAHPLLAAWGKQGRDFIGLLDEHDDETARAGYLGRFNAIGQRIDLFDASQEARSLLEQLQDDIRDLRPLAETRTQWPEVSCTGDASIRFHVAHSPQREVEILHDQLLAAFNADASLTPRDIIVMVPDIETYAPHIQAVFGLIDREDPRYIPYSVADQGQRATEPLIQALEKLLELPRSRLAASDVLDLLEAPALRRRFGIAETDLPRLHRWIRGANIRWGLHAEQRASLDLPTQPDAHAQHTWLFGLRRMLLGYAVGSAGEEGAWQGIESFDEIGGLDAVLLGPLVQLIERLDATWRTLREPATVPDWCTRLRTLMADFFDAADSAEGFTLMQLDTALQGWQEACDEAALAEKLPLSVVGEYWLSQLDDGGLSQRFFAGAVTFATLMPMRAIPFRRVCLLGMNDGDYPRTRIPMDFDLMGRDYRPGDRSRREDDRYLFLEALLSARDHLHISWVGRSITDNGVRPPSVLVAQLRDHLAAGWRMALDTAIPEEARAIDPGQALLNALTSEHPLQPFSPDYFPPELFSEPGPMTASLFTYAREWRPLDAARPHRPDAVPQAPEAALPPLSRNEPLALRDLVDFLKSPVKAFFRQRLGVVFESEDPTSEDQEPFTLDGLARWQLQDELIRVQEQALAHGEPIVAARETRLDRVRRRGDLAPGAFGEAVAADLVAPMDGLFTRYREALARWPHPLDDEEEIRFQADLPEPVPELADWIGGIRTDADGRRGRVFIEASDLVKNNQYRGEKLIRHWVAHLALHLAGGPLTTLVLSKAGEVELKPLPVEQANAHLSALLAAWQVGMGRPLPLAAKTALEWLKAGDVSKARTTYEGGYKHIGEVETDAYVARAYPDFDRLRASGEFAELAEDLLRPLYRAMHADNKKKPDRPAAPQTTGAAV
ncbi:DNA helicase/exodeoxyribonuclease V gamma subunit [Thiocapsa rosea]|uniref:RecBCD enzyme subunit RecC n=1 Tax=Thiocapsa rosea TaxID=69360 RepID=A0A495VBW3_9GAMM|nr:exodeoxyribonuclease V subunit gamma [Thiocapsa rosea]RKT45867.1 DNA helicase/exodeoxyribonuclease V gamma subunit [Thiocapsa rosea]